MRVAIKRFLLLVLASIVAGSTSTAHAQGIMKQAWGVASGYGIEVQKAWSLMSAKVSCSHSGVVVAVIDTGIDTNHPALKNVLWTNPRAGAVHKSRDGKLTFKNDLHGWDFARNSGTLMDLHGHGSHIAGIIAGDGQDAESFKGVCPGVKIMALRYYDPQASGDDNLSNTIKAINYAVDNGANVINYSGGGAEKSEAEYEALKRAADKGIIVFAAAGNEHSNSDTKLYYPAAYGLPNMVSVTAIDEHGIMLPSSNWGPKKVDIAAPGQYILSTLPGGTYGFMSGTSQATAFGSGVAALLLSQNPSLLKDAPSVRLSKLKNFIESSVQVYAELKGKIKTGGRLDAYTALEKMTHPKATTPRATSLVTEIPSVYRKSESTVIRTNGQITPAAIPSQPLEQ